MSTVTPPKRLSAVVFGYGPRVGRGVVQKLLAEGFTVAAGNRHPDYEAAKREGYHAFYIDCTDSDNFTSVAEKVRVDLLGEEGYFNVVIYNGELPPFSSKTSEKTYHIINLPAIRL